MRIGTIEVKNPVFLAPMAGVTDWAFRTICAELGAGVTVTEMVSSRALVYRDQKSAKLLRKNPGSVCGAQIFGNDPDTMAEGARLALEISGCDFLDINMGCPMPKVANNGDGCGLMRTPELAGKIVETVVKAVDVPVTVKCRLGWDKGSINVLDFTRRMEDSGAAMVAVHGRTRSMLYSGTADWDAIRKVKEQLTVPVIANGDITGGETYRGGRADDWPERVRRPMDISGGQRRPCRKSLCRTPLSQRPGDGGGAAIPACRGRPRRTHCLSGSQKALCVVLKGRSPQRIL